MGCPRSHDMDYHGLENKDFEEKEYKALNIEDEFNDHMEEDDHVLDNIFEDDCKKTFIHDTLSGKTHHNYDQDDFNDVHDLPIHYNIRIEEY